MNGKAGWILAWALLGGGVVAGNAETNYVFVVQAADGKVAEQYVPEGAGGTIWNLVRGFEIETADNFCVVNVGQLKNVAKPFYDRLNEEHCLTNTYYPWTPETTGDDQDYALANISQLKHVFDFVLTNSYDGDRMPDWWEWHWFGGTTALDWQDADGDGLPDGWEVAHGLSPREGIGPDGRWGDPDGDGVLNLDEYRLGSDPQDADSDGDDLLDGEEVSTYRTDPVLQDTDGDGLSDNAEVHT